MPPPLRKLFETNKALAGEKLRDVPNPIGLTERYRRVIEGEALEILSRMLDLNPETRITAREALDHPYFAPCRQKDPSFRSPEKTRDDRNLLDRQLSKDNSDSAFNAPLTGSTVQDSTAARERLPGQNATGIRIKTLSEPPSQKINMKYSKTQNLMQRMAEENKELHGPSAKTYYTMNEGSGYPSVNKGPGGMYRPFDSDDRALKYK